MERATLADKHQTKREDQSGHLLTRKLKLLFLPISPMDQRASF